MNLYFSQHYYTATQEQLLQELVYPGTNISTIPITILTTILYTSKQIFFLNHNTGIQYWNNLGRPVLEVVVLVSLYNNFDSIHNGLLCIVMYY
jgi:hypothetical protein